MSNFSVNRFRFLRCLLILSLFGAAASSTARGQVPAFAGGPPSSAAEGKQTAVLAGGCFWGVDAVFEHVKGVKSVVAGYFRGKRGDREIRGCECGQDGARRVGEDHL